VLVVLIPISAVAGTASTMANVTAAATAATIVARRRGTLDDAIFRGASPSGGSGAQDAAPAVAAPRSRREARTGPTAVVPVLPARELVEPVDDETAALPDDVLLGQCELPGSRAARSTDPETVRTP